MYMREILFLTNAIILLFYFINFFISIEEFNKKIDCALFWTAIIVPYRNRSNQLPYFVHAIHKHNIYNNFKNVSIHTYLIITYSVVMPFSLCAARSKNKENISYGFSGIKKIVCFYDLQYAIFIIEQDDNFKFNRGKLLNIGATFALEELQRKCGSQTSQINVCLIFHDVDMIPLNSKIPYHCENR